LSFLVDLIRTQAISLQVFGNFRFNGFEFPPRSPFCERGKAERVITQVQTQAIVVQRFHDFKRGPVVVSAYLLITISLTFFSSVAKRGAKAVQGLPDANRQSSLFVSRVGGSSCYW
jgi:hypothetical protein